MNKNVKRKLSFILAFSFIIMCFNSTISLAFDTGYNNATTYTSAVNGYIESSTQIDWYQFTLTEEQVPTTYSIQLKIPTECIYNFDLRYRTADSTARPSVVSNETIVTSARIRTMKGMITDPGTYFVRVYSQNGTTDSNNNYKLTISSEKNTTYFLDYGNEEDLPGSVDTDWSICADIIGNQLFNNVIKNSSTGRNYKNAYTFINSNYSSENQNGYGHELKATPEQTAIAADYIYSGDLMTIPKFKVERDKQYSIEEMAYRLRVLNEPVIFYLEVSSLPEEFRGLYERYVILSKANIALKTMAVYDPSIGEYSDLDYDEFIRKGIQYSSTFIPYNSTNIVSTNTKPIQAVYN